MTAPRATLVVQFGSGESESEAFVTAEFDDLLNIDAAGNVKTSWAPSDTIWFWVQHEATLRIDAIKPTGGAGTIVDCGFASRQRRQDLLWTVNDTDQELSYIPTAMPALTWYGAPGDGLQLNGRALSISGGAPCTCDAVIPVEVRLYQFIPPPMILTSEKDTYRVVICVYMATA